MVKRKAEVPWKRIQGKGLPTLKYIYFLLHHIYVLVYKDSQAYLFGSEAEAKRGNVNMSGYSNLVLVGILAWSGLLYAGEPKTALELAAESLAPGAFAEFKTEGYEYQTLMRGEDILAYSGKAGYDARNRQVHLIGQVHLKGPPVHIRYDLATNAWTQMPTSEWAKPLKWFHAYENNAADGEGGYFFHNASASGLVHRFEAAKNEWTTLPELKAPHGHGMALAYFPERRSLIRYLGKEVWEFNSAAGQWAALSKEAAAGPYHNLACYSAGFKTVLLGGGNGSGQLYRLDIQGKLNASKPAPFNLGVGMSLTECDPASGELVAVSNAGKVAAYHPGQDTWRELAAAAPFKGGHGVSVAPIRGAGVLFYFSSAPQGMKVWLYKHAAQGK